MNHKPYRAFWCALNLGVMAVSVPLAAHAQSERRLDQADAKFPEAFSFISRVRELRDGRLLVADPLGQALMVVDLDAGVADTIGRIGSGPAEFKQPDAVFPMPGDSTLLVDLGNGRLVMLGPDLSFGESTPIAQGGDSPGAGPGGGMQMVLPRGTDSQGRIYFQGMGIRMGPGGGLADSTPVMRWDRSTGAMDTVAMVKPQGRTQSSAGGAGNRNMMIRPIPYSPQDAWSVGWNGRVAAARSAGYYLEWVDSEGGHTRGTDVSFRPVRIRQAEKEEYVENIGTSGLSVGMTIDNGVRQVAFSRGGGGMGGMGGLPDVDGFDWPDTKPAFTDNAVWVTPEGEAWVRRSTAAGADRLYDVFDASGNHKEQIVLPPSRELVGFGSEHVYVVMRDEFDLLWLEKYRRTT